jgi:Zn-dependent membrane protease YugP
MFIFSPTYLVFMIPAFLLTMLAQIYVNSAYRKWSQIPARSGMSGAQATQRLIHSGYLNDVQIQGTPGNLSDHYDPRTKELRLSQNTYQGRSVASLAIAAHEIGHAMQDQDSYLPLRLRAMLVPAVNIGSYLGWIFIILGLILRITDLAWLGIIIFSGGAVFALATIPVELNASSRAKRILRNSGLIQGPEEQRGINTVLNAAALTYVAALFTSIMQLLYWISIVGGIGNRRR